MASPAKQTSTIRKRKQARMGSKRKAKLRSQGTTRSASELFQDEEK